MPLFYRTSAVRVSSFLHLLSSHRRCNLEKRWVLATAPTHTHTRIVTCEFLRLSKGARERVITEDQLEERVNVETEQSIGVGLAQMLVARACRVIGHPGML